MQIRTLGPIAMAFGLAAASSAYAAPVTVTANFTQFTVDIGYAGLPTNVNGTTIADGSTTTGITTGLSGSSVTFDYGYLPNMFSFTSSIAEVPAPGPSNQFKLGSFTYTNGFFHILAYIDFTLTTSSVDASLNGHTFQGRIRLDSNFNAGTPEQAADYFTVQNSSGNTLASLGSVRIYDYSFCPAGDPSAPLCNTGSVDLFGHINSLHLDQFANPSGGAFLNGSITSELSPTSAVPEPGSGMLVISGLLSILPFGKMFRIGKKKMPLDL